MHALRSLPGPPFLGLSRHASHLPHSKILLLLGGASPLTLASARAATSTAPLAPIVSVTMTRAGGTDALGLGIAGRLDGEDMKGSLLSVSSFMNPFTEDKPAPGVKVDPIHSLTHQECANNRATVHNDTTNHARKASQY
jgi:hypothetical protein